LQLRDLLVFARPRRRGPEGRLLRLRAGETPRIRCIRELHWGV